MEKKITPIEEKLKENNIIQDQIDDIIFNLIKIRKKRKVTQLELARKTRLPQSTISRMESFSSKPTLNVLLKVSNALGHTLELKGLNSDYENKEYIIK